MAIRVIPQPEISEEPIWLKLLFVLSIIFFLLSSFSYFFLTFALKNTQENITRLEESLTAKTEEERVSEEKVLSYQQKIDGVAVLLKHHKKPTKFFELLEELIHPQVWFSQLKLDSEKGIVNLEGQTEDFQTLSQQQILFQNNPLFKKVELQSVSLAEGGKVKFVFNLLLAPKLLSQ